MAILIKLSNILMDFQKFRGKESRAGIGRFVCWCSREVLVPIFSSMLCVCFLVYLYFNLCIFLRWFIPAVAHIMSKKLLGSIMILLLKFHWIETTLQHFECPTRHDYIQPKNILAPACVHYLKRIGIMQISLRYLLWNVRINAAYSNVVVAVVDRGTRGTGWLPTR